jgi:hypothetical protein
MERIRIAETKFGTIKPDNAGTAGLNHLDGATDMHAQFLQAMHVILATQQLINPGMLPRPQHVKRQEVRHGGRKAG